MPCTAYNWVGGWVEINWSRGVATVGGCAHGRSLGRRLLSLAPCVLGSLGAPECWVLLLNAALALLAIPARSCKICSPALAPHLARRAQGNPHRSRARREDKPTGQWAGRARTPLWAPPGVVWRWIHSSAPAPRCCRCGGWAGRGTLCLRLPAAWPCPAPLTDTRCTHVRAGLLLLLAVVRPTTGSLLPSPPAACSVSTRGAPRVTTDNWVGRVGKFHWLDVATVSAALAVVTLAWECAAPNRSSEVSSSVLVRCRC